MDWWIRFVLGLPARAEDVEAIRRTAPELLRESPHVRLEYPGALHHVELKEWIRRGFGKSGRAHDPSTFPADAPLSEVCPAEACPLRGLATKPDAQEGTPNQGSKETLPETDEAFAWYARLIGNISGSLKSAFFDLVQKTHRDRGRPTKVFITDPYLYASEDESGNGGESNELIFEYLAQLGLDEHARFVLAPSPSPRRQKPAGWDQRFSARFPFASIEPFAAGRHFHDRLYIAIHSGEPVGVFGPSLSALDSAPFVIAGAIGDKGLLRKIQRILQGRP